MCSLHLLKAHVFCHCGMLTLMDTYNPRRNSTAVQWRIDVDESESESSLILSGCSFIYSYIHIYRYLSANGVPTGVSSVPVLA